MENDMVKVVKRQKVSDDCFVCGSKNPHGFKAAFYELESGEVISLVKSDFFYQSYPGRMHGGISATVLDEVMGRAMLVCDPNVWGVTVDMQLRYRKPVPLGETLRVIGRVKNFRHLSTIEGEILGEDGTVLVSAESRYMRMTIGSITGNEHDSGLLYDLIPENDLTAVTTSGVLRAEYAHRSV